MAIASAIQNQKLLRFGYEGQLRTVEPHTYGRDRKGQRMLRAYQVGGGSNSGARTGWKFFCERHMRELTVLEETFRGPRPEYKRGDPFFTHIIAQL
jgi:hypothetical protein